MVSGPRNHLFLLYGYFAFVEQCLSVCGTSENADKVPPSQTEWLESTQLGRSRRPRQGQLRAPRQPFAQAWDAAEQGQAADLHAECSKSNYCSEWTTADAVDCD